jgi:hypothetical protein
MLLLVEGACAWGNIVEDDGVQASSHDAGPADAKGGREDSGSPDAATDGSSDADAGGDPCANPNVCGASGDPLVRHGWCEAVEGNHFRCRCARGFSQPSEESALDTPCSVDVCAPERDTCGLGTCLRLPQSTHGPPELTDGTFWPGDWYCECPAGTTQPDGNTYLRCEDLNECALGTHACGLHEICRNLAPSYTCDCKLGFVRSGADCVDVDECQNNNGGCAAHATCTNTEGWRTCTCAEGFEGNGDYECLDIDECKSGNGPCDWSSSSCTNEVGSYRCSCLPGFRSTSKFTCADINECENGSLVCTDPHATCVNTDGSARCECTGGWHMSGSVCVDPCNGRCSPEGTCDDTTGTCQCPPWRSPYNCGTYHACERTYAAQSCNVGEGSFCVDLADGWACCRSGGHDCDVADTTALCAAGYAPCANGDGTFRCEQPQLCLSALVSPPDLGAAGTRRPENLAAAILAHPFPADAAAQRLAWAKEARWAAFLNSAGEDSRHVLRSLRQEFLSSPLSATLDDLVSFVSDALLWLDGPCPQPGFDWLQGVCVDVDECAARPGRCGAHGACHNTSGSFTCLCDSGYSGAQGPCRDVNECLSGTPVCPSNATCQNEPGTFRCECRSGYRATEGGGCADVDECAPGEVGCLAPAACLNYEGGFYCLCPPGYSEAYDESTGGCRDVIAGMEGLTLRRKCEAPAPSGSSTCPTSSTPIITEFAVGGAPGASYDLSLSFQGPMQAEYFLSDGSPLLSNSNAWTIETSRGSKWRLNDVAHLPLTVPPTTHGYYYFGVQLDVRVHSGDVLRLSSTAPSGGQTTTVQNDDQWVTVDVISTRDVPNFCVDSQGQERCDPLHGYCEEDVLWTPYTCQCDPGYKLTGNGWSHGFDCVPE